MSNRGSSFSSDTQSQELGFAVHNAAERAVSRVGAGEEFDWTGKLTIAEQAYPGLVRLKYSGEDGRRELSFYTSGTNASIDVVEDRYDLRYTPFSDKHVGSPVLAVEDVDEKTVIVAAVKGYPLNTAALEDVVHEHVQNLAFNKR